MSSARREKILALSLALLFLVIHAVMYFVFKHNKIPPLAILNLASVTFYVGMLILILNDKLYEFVVASFVEICFHMAVTIYCTGWNSGFQVTFMKQGGIWKIAGMAVDSTLNPAAEKRND